MLRDLEDQLDWEENQRHYDEFGRSLERAVAVAFLIGVCLGWLI